MLLIHIIISSTDIDVSPRASPFKISVLNNQVVAHNMDFFHNQTNAYMYVIFWHHHHITIRHLTTPPDNCLNSE